MGCVPSSNNSNNKRKQQVHPTIDVSKNHIPHTPEHPMTLPTPTTKSAIFFNILQPPSLLPESPQVSFQIPPAMLTDIITPDDNSSSMTATIMNFNTDSPSSKPLISIILSQNDLFDSTNTAAMGCRDECEESQDPPPAPSSGSATLFTKSLFSGTMSDHHPDTPTGVESSGNASIKSTHEIVRGVDTDGNKLLNEYMIIATLGKGSFGKVKLAIDTQTEKSVAIKVLNRAELEKRSHIRGEDGRGLNMMQQVQQEIEIMKACRHPNLVRLIHVIRDPTDPKLYMVMEYMEEGTLSTTPALQDKQHDSQTYFPTDNVLEAAWRSFRDVLFGLQFLHSKGVVHMDIKPENILVGKDGTCKLA
eukprot:PhF_6_TR1424/c1_g1_i2/m.2504